MFNCPSCAKKLDVTEEEINKNEGNMTDCPNCETVLVVRHGRFQEYISSWNLTTH